MKTRIVMQGETAIAVLVSAVLLGFTLITIAGTYWYPLQPMETMASDFSLIDLDGNAFRLSEFRGKVVVIEFMATWCGYCRQQILELKVVWEKYGGKIILMSIDIDPLETAEVLRSFAQQYPYATWVWVRDTANVAQAYRATAIPKTVIIDQQGNIRFTHTGLTAASTLIQEIDQLLS